ncbi:SWI/SNF-related matrix-associated actin-dependent regulator of chromatin subfamily D member 1 [Manis javanica]|nr:SWI/SNF-related matrix-associated actin-dependent regulator of chromatin subfamily D member 1 [Manis javanica]
MHQAPPDLCGAQPQGTDRMAKEEGASSKGIPENVALPGRPGAAEPADHKEPGHPGGARLSAPRGVNSPGAPGKGGNPGGEPGG